MKLPAAELEVERVVVVRPERTGWRDEALSLRHRDWGFNCPAIDIDFLMLEFDHGRPAALVEYKHDGYDPRNMNEASWNALRVLSANNRIPLFMVVYAKDLTWYEIEPKNELAAAMTPKMPILTEYEYVSFLYLIRKRKMTGELAREILGRNRR